MLRKCMVVELVEPYSNVSYISLFTSLYNTTYTNSYALEQKFKDSKSLKVDEPTLHIFYKLNEVSEELLTEQITYIKTLILNNLKQLISKVTIDESSRILE